MPTINSLRPQRNAKGQFVPKAPSKVSGNGHKAPKATPTATPAPEAPVSRFVVRDPEAPASFRQRKMIAALTGTFPTGELSKGTASAAITALLANAS